MNFLELVQLFQNLAGNALKFRTNTRTPEIHISAKRMSSVQGPAFAEATAGTQGEVDSEPGKGSTFCFTLPA